MADLETSPSPKPTAQSTAAVIPPPSSAVGKEETKKDTRTGPEPKREQGTLIAQGGNYILMLPDGEAIKIQPEKTVEATINGRKQQLSIHETSSELGNLASLYFGADRAAVIFRPNGTAKVDLPTEKESQEAKKDTIALFCCKNGQSNLKLPDGTMLNLVPGEPQKVSVDGKPHNLLLQFGYSEVMKANMASLYVDGKRQAVAIENGAPLKVELDAAKKK